MAGGFSDEAFSVGAFTPLAFLFEEAEAAGLPLTWDQIARPWGEANYMYSAAKPIMVINGKFFESDAGVLTQEEPIVCVLSRTGLTIFGRDREGNWKIDPGIIKHVSGFWPIVKGAPGTVLKIYVGGQETPDSPVQWGIGRNFVVGQDYFLDFDVAFRYLAVRIESEGQEPWQLKSYDLEIDIVGER